MRWWMVFRKIVGSVVYSFGPVHTELLVTSFIGKPVPSHVPPGLGTVLLDIGMADSVRGGVVGLERHSELRMAQSL
jgi:hypothetical protein